MFVFCCVFSYFFSSYFPPDYIWPNICTSVVIIMLFFLFFFFCFFFIIFPSLYTSPAVLIRSIALIHPQHRYLSGWMFSLWYSNSILMTNRRFLVSIQFRYIDEGRVRRDNIEPNYIRSEFFITSQYYNTLGIYIDVMWMLFLLLFLLFLSCVIYPHWIRNEKQNWKAAKN